MILLYGLEDDPGKIGGIRRNSSSEYVKHLQLLSYPIHNIADS